MARGIEQKESRRTAASPATDGAALYDDVAHHPQCRLRWRRDEGWMPNSQALLSRAETVTHAVVFVHGWGGDACKTWERFPEVIAAGTGAGKVDAFFVEYPSRSHSVPFCASKLRHFLHDLVRDPWGAMLDASLPSDAARRPPDARYERIFLLAHSMGAVVARRALLDLALDEVERQRFRLLFFAPAHCGSSVARLISSGFGLDFLPGARLVGEAARVFMRSLSDLEPGSQTLTQLAADARARHDTIDGGAGYLRARVFHASGDKVVEQNDFVGDPPLEPVMGKNHRTICKPDGEFMTPEVLTSLLGLHVSAIDA